MNKKSPSDLSQNLSSLSRVIRKLFSYYPRLAPLTVVCILFSAIISAIPSIFVQKVLAVVEQWYRSRDWAAARPEIVRYLFILASLYLLSLVAFLFFPVIHSFLILYFKDVNIVG